MQWNECAIAFRVQKDVKRQNAHGTPGVCEVWASTDSMDAERVGEMIGFALVNADSVKRLFGDYAVDRSPYGPGRDCLILI